MRYIRQINVEGRDQVMVQGVSRRPPHLGLPNRRLSIGKTARCASRNVQRVFERCRSRRCAALAVVLKQDLYFRPRGAVEYKQGGQICGLSLGEVRQGSTYVEIGLRRSSA